MSTYRLFPSTDGPDTAVSYTGSITLGVQFEVTTGGCWLEGYWFWVCGSGAPTKPQGFALWQAYTDVGGTGSLIPGSTVTSGTLKAGAWNYVALDTPVPLSIGATYIGATGLTGGFPQTTDKFGPTPDAYSAGITDGPLFAYSDQSGSQPAPDLLDQGLYSTAGADPSEFMPGEGNSSANFWVDVQITTTAPSGASYRLWPSYPTIAGEISDDPFAQSMGTEFWLSEACTLNKLWFYSPPSTPEITIKQLPTACAIWNVPATVNDAASMIADTENSSPSWSGNPGTGWVAVDYSAQNVTLQPGQYKATVYCGVDDYFYQENTHYFSTPQTSVQSVALSLPLTGWWQLDGNATDSAGSDNGAVNGSVVFGQAGPLQGGTAAGFSGSASITTGLDLSAYTALSFAAFVRVASGASGIQTVMGSSSASIQLVDSGGSMQIELTVGTTTVSFLTGATWADDNWHLVAVTWDGSTATGFLDASTLTSAPLSGPIGSGTVTIGGDFDGGLAHVMVSNQAWYVTPPEGQVTYAEALWYPSQFTTGSGRNGITSGPLYSPDILHSGAVTGNWTNLPMAGNSSYSNPNPEFIYPDLYDIKDGGENRWVDVEVTPVVITPPPVPASPSVVLTFFP
jgi:Concanavalin A-like lectin/glucanases superfamily/Domain of unknown function (DUF4082)